MASPRFAPPPVSLRQLQYVVAIAEAGSFRGAAKLCHVSQPSLSAQIADVEGALGVVLFERGRWGARATKAGEEVLARARRVLVEARELLAAAGSFVDPLAGELRVGVIPTLGPYLLPKIVPELRRAFPSLILAWLEDKTEVLVAKIESGELDAGLMAAEADLGALETVSLAIDPFVLAVWVGHPLAGRRRGSSAKSVKRGRRRDQVELSALDQEKVLLLDDGHCFRTQALSVCGRAGAQELGFRATSLSTLVQMVAGGAGITLLPKLAVELECGRAPLVTRELAQPGPSRTIVLAHRRGSAIQAALERLAEVMRSGLG